MIFVTFFRLFWVVLMCMLSGGGYKERERCYPYNRR
ncbi:hypothetical protein SAMN04515649_102357 [Eubacterium callanderi]|uniref:Uncharacterized protein n=2 Tax=Eubacterium callanderi TaxID=53442 RepID=E3GFP6_9FIRM|nr:hypothetical protein ELI_3421 [Eubacterium callanderi]OEZ05489.1 hypothetical protein BUME_12140 [[Butyribacterium] methylotrophicum]WPK84309.1 hypothetical protein EUCAMar_18510 [Eubacterium callanderi]SHL12505.1 hypothetical protein SAMN04515649_102357 [Eubacterium callanderi]